MAAVMFSVLIILIFLNIPVAVSIGLASVAGITLSSLPLNPAVVAQRMFTSADSFPFMAIPFFMLAGGLMEHGGFRAGWSGWPPPWWEATGEGSGL